jgi:glycosyltransferase involved in cell wall biosynthesis
VTTTRAQPHPSLDRHAHIVICNWRDGRHPQAGGAELYCERVAQQLRRRGAQVTLLASRPKGAARSEETSFGRTVRGGGTFTVYLYVLWWLLWHRRSVDAVIDSQNGIPFFSPLAVRRSTPVILLIHHVHQHQFMLYFRWPLNRIGQWLEKNASRRVYRERAICVVSPSSRTEVRRQLRLRGPIFVAACGQDRPVGSDRVRSERPRIVVVGRVVGHKRFDVLVRAMPAILARCRGAELHVVGDGAQLAELRQLAEATGVADAVHFHGRISDEARDRLLRSAWITVGSSVGEGWGLSMVEAAAAGVPAVGLRVPGLRDSILDGHTGWLVDEVDDLGSAVIDALHRLADPRLAAAMEQRCRAWAGRFTWQATADRLFAVLSGESGRLRAGAADSGRASDATTLIELPVSGLFGADLTKLPGTDQIDFGADSVRLLMLGGDEHDALARLRLSGVEGPVTARPARPFELLGWSHNLLDVRRPETLAPAAPA